MPWDSTLTGTDGATAGADFEITLPGCKTKNKSATARAISSVAITIFFMIILEKLIFWR
jgi:hypothetical protein